MSRTPRTRVLRRGVAALAVGVLTLSMAACGGDDDKKAADGNSSSAGDGGTTTAGDAVECKPGDALKLQLQWVAQGQFAGYYAAVDQGYYSDEGLDVEIVEGGPDIVPQDALANGEVDYAISWVPKVLGSIEQGAKITNVAQIFERSGTLQISMKDKNITSPADLKGKNVGSWGYGNEWELFAGMQKAGVQVGDFNLITQAFDMNGFLAGDIDAAQAMTYNELAQVLETVNPDTKKLYTMDDLNVINWNDVGTAMLQDAIWAPTASLQSDSCKDQTTKFVKASIKGWVYARDNAEKAAQIVADAGSQLPAGHQLWMTNEINKLIWPSTNGIGMIDDAAWKQTVDIALATKNETGATIITKEPDASVKTNEFVEKALTELRGEGVDVDGKKFTPLEVTLKEGGE